MLKVFRRCVTRLAAWRGVFICLVTRWFRRRRADLRSPHPWHGEHGLSAAAIGCCSARPRDGALALPAIAAL